MRVLVVLCFFGLAYASPLGYNYDLPATYSGSAISIAPGSSVPYDAPTSGYLAPSYPAPSYPTEYNDGSSHFPNTEYNKEFFSFSAPEEEFNDADAGRIIAQNAKQNLRVIFIKSPENRGLENVALALAKQSAHQHTAIYVLNKQADISDLANKLEVASKHVNSKPDVHFIKYRTSEDAAYAQKAIQSQYDTLGGSSQSFNGGVAPVINFASITPVRETIAQVPQKTYLPSSLFRFPA